MGVRRIRRVAAAMAAISSSFSTIFIWAGARQIGRDPSVDFMQVGMVPLRRRALSEQPRPAGVLAGAASHQFADVLWAWIFFRYLLPRRQRPAWQVLAASQIPWALASSAAEYYVFLPWVQPWLRMQVPYWVASGVHVSSSLAYGLWPWVAGSDQPGDRRFARGTAVAMTALVAGSAALTLLSRRGRSPRWPGVDRDGPEARFLHRMYGHHEAGLELSQLAAERAESGGLRALGRLMTAQHRAELRLMADEWRGWFGGDVPTLTPDERQAMYGMPEPTQVDALRTLDGHTFDRRFAELMIPHHIGAIGMAEDIQDDGRDPRILGLAAGIRHSQVGQVEAMNRLTFG